MQEDYSHKYSKITLKENLLEEERRLSMELKNKKNISIDISLIAIFGAQIGIFAVLAWIVPFGHITMEFIINCYIIIFLKLKKRNGSMFILGIIVGIIDAIAGLGGSGVFLAPIVYGFRFGFLEISEYKLKAKNNSKLLSILNAIGYFLTSVLIWLMYFVLGIPLGDEMVKSMWFIFAFAGAIISIPDTLFAYKIAQKIMKII